MLPSLLVAIMWEARRGGHIACGELRRRPDSWEVRVTVDGHTHQTRVQRRRDTAEDVAHDWQAVFAREGWR